MSHFTLPFLREFSHQPCLTTFRMLIVQVIFNTWFLIKTRSIFLTTSYLLHEKFLLKYEFESLKMHLRHLCTFRSMSNFLLFLVIPTNFIKFLSSVLIFKSLTFNIILNLLFIIIIPLKNFIDHDKYVFLYKEKTKHLWSKSLCLKITFTVKSYFIQSPNLYKSMFTLSLWIPGMTICPTLTLT